MKWSKYAQVLPAGVFSPVRGAAGWQQWLEEVPGMVEKAEEERRRQELVPWALKHLSAAA